MNGRASSLLAVLCLSILILQAGSFSLTPSVPVSGKANGRFRASMARPLRPSTSCSLFRPRMQVGWTGGDLEGGRDDERNADIQALKKLFYKTDTDQQPMPSSQELLRDIPIARFRMVVLPHQQVVFNIFQPQLVHMFETVLAAPKPWLYLHVLLPGGVDNLGNPQYALPGLGEDETGTPGKKATLQGTLMHITAMERQPDSRIALVCQGLSRAVVIRGTQALPFSRGDVQILPDAEQLRAWAEKQPHASEKAWLMSAVTEDLCWKEFEFAPMPEVDPFGSEMAAMPFAFYDQSALQSCVDKARDLQARESQSAAEQGEQVGSEEGKEKEGGHEEAIVGLRRVLTEARRAMEDEEAEDEALRLASLEVQVWLELDAFLRELAAPDLPGPSGLEDLLPPPPAAGWPPEFVMHKVREAHARAKAQGEAAGGNPSETAGGRGGAPAEAEAWSAEYPARRRQARLSHLLWAAITQEVSDAWPKRLLLTRSLFGFQDNRELQGALETPSTGDRLRLGCARIRQVREMLRKKGEDDGGR